MAGVGGLATVNAHKISTLNKKYFLSGGRFEDLIAQMRSLSRAKIVLWISPVRSGAGRRGALSPLAREIKRGGLCAPYGPLKAYHVGFDGNPRDPCANIWCGNHSGWSNSANQGRDDADGFCDISGRMTATFIIALSDRGFVRKSR